MREIFDMDIDGFPLHILCSDGRCRRCQAIHQSRSEGYLTPNEDYETALVILDELDKGASKRGFARSTSVARGTIQKIEKKRDRYTAE